MIPGLLAYLVLACLLSFVIVLMAVSHFIHKRKAWRKAAKDQQQISLQGILVIQPDGRMCAGVSLQ